MCIILEWVWVNRNGPITEMVDLNPAQNGGKNFFHAMLPPMTQVRNEVTACQTMPSYVLFFEVGGWFYNFFLTFL